VPASSATKSEPPGFISYRISPDRESSYLLTEPRLTCLKSRRLKTGAIGKSTDFDLFKVLRGSIPGLLQPLDIELAHHLAVVMPNRFGFQFNEIRLTGPHAIHTFQLLLSTGRCHWMDLNTPALRLGKPRPGTLGWRTDPSGQLQTSMETQPRSHHLIAWPSPWYLDLECLECGPVEIETPQKLVTTWLNAPALDPVLASSHADILQEQFRILRVPPPVEIEIHRPSIPEPVPVLHLASVKLSWWEAPWAFRSTGGDTRDVLAAQVSFDYGLVTVASADHRPEVRKIHQGQLNIIARNKAFESNALEKLRSIGMVQSSQAYHGASRTEFETSWSLQDRSDEAIVRFLNEKVPGLKGDGWRITRDPSFALEVIQPTEWYFETEPEPEESQFDWFGVELGVRVGDERINLLPVILEGLQRHLSELSPDSLSKKSAKDSVLIVLPDGRRIPFPAGRLRRILAILLELHAPNPEVNAGRLRVHRLRAAQLGELADTPDWKWSGAERLRDLAERLRTVHELPKVAPPAGLMTTLRPYQGDGLQWLQFLREFELGGVLADDMGLGKTIQTLAHLMVEKESGRLDRPALVVSPTSVLVNWKDELARFTPSLRVLPLHGTERHNRFADLPTSDVVLTTYALLPRDATELLKADFHCVILDEAQNIKNPKTQAAQTVCQLKARHRICLSGTPLENHLGELWSLFNFLIPGFLSDETRFRAVYRLPIEKENDAARRTHLARRVRPFLLRRRKDQVAQDLPEKTEIVQKIELAGKQRDLYETIRLAMEARVREEVQKKGVHRSQIIILDALLKLRQVCCDPRLVPLEAAREVSESAKLDYLMDLIPTLIEEGRRILLFSQFTSLLALVQERLEAARIPWLLLTGDTVDRSTPVNRFQAGEVPLFLLSLKAGGSGLNLTAADTVILFDPWWNPAVEAQATDRAHRIGQTKPVFVYRLIAAGTVEEKMAELQSRKRELVQALLEEGTQGSLRLEKEDLDLLFAPIGST